MTHTIDNLSNIVTSTGAAQSRIRDTDYAKETSELARTQIIQQAATAMLAQANQQPQLVLSYCSNRSIFSITLTPALRGVFFYKE